MKMKRSRLLVVIALALVCLSATTLRSQSTTKSPSATIMGSLLDVADARITHARVRIENAQFKWSGETDDSGDFTALVPPGTYRIYADANGFRKFESPFLKAKADVKELVNLHLEVLVPIDTVEIKKP